MSDIWLFGDSALTSSNLHLSVDQFLDEQLATKRALYQANGSSWICKFFQKGNCARGQECPYRHSRGDKPFICKYWIRGMCKKGADTCESLHVYDLSKMPYCQFVIDYGSCTNVDCLFNHSKPEVEEADCIWYARGFCKRGPQCKNRHRKREMCPDYLSGFCELGPQCEKGHPKWEFPADTEAAPPQYDAAGNLINDVPRHRTLRDLVGMDMPEVKNLMNKNRPGGPPVAKDLSGIKCNVCQQFGHYAASCPSAAEGSSHKPIRDLSSVQCHKCGEMGHYANLCPNPRREPPPGGWPLPPGAKPKDRSYLKRPRQY